MRRLFYRGRHHVRTAPRLADGALVTVSTIAARLRREARWAACGSAHLVIVPKGTGKFSSAIHRALEAVNA